MSGSATGILETSLSLITTIKDTLLNTHLWKVMEAEVQVRIIRG